MIFTILLLSSKLFYIISHKNVGEKRNTKNGPKLSLALIGIFLILCEFFYGIPFLGATFILSFGWQPLLFNALLYLILTIILLVNRQMRLDL